jgi:hypothetical protein
VKISKTLMVGAALLTFAAAQPAAASIITSLPAGVAAPMPSLDYQGVGPQVFGAGNITWTSNYSYSLFGYVDSYGFSDANWSGTPMTGTNNETGTMSFAFGTGIAAFLAELNWVAGDSGGESGIFVRAYDSSNNLLESLQVADTSVNLVSPGYYGFQRASNDIARIDLTGGYIGARNISTSDLGVPEPASWALMILGFGSVGTLLRIQRRRVRTSIA